MCGSVCPTLYVCRVVRPLWSSHDNFGQSVPIFRGIFSLAYTLPLLSTEIRVLGVQYESETKADMWKASSNLHHERQVNHLVSSGLAQCGDEKGTHNSSLIWLTLPYLHVSTSHLGDSRENL